MANSNISKSRHIEYISEKKVYDIIKNINLNNISKSLQIFLQQPNALAVKTNPHKFIPVQVNILAKNVDKCYVTIEYDNEYFELVNGDKSTTLDSGSFSRQLAWILKVKKNSTIPLWIEVKAEATNLFQVAGFNINI